MIPYSRHSISQEDIDAVEEVLKSDWLTTGPLVDRFETAMAQYAGTKHSIAVANGTAALHAAVHAIGIDPDDEVIVPAMTFVATANAVVYNGGKPVFADVDEETLLLDLNDVQEKITERTRAIIAVDYAGHPCNYDGLRALCEKRGLDLISDASHAIGAKYKGQNVGTLADLTTFSFHPLKHITTGEGGAVLTDSAKLCAKLKAFRNHGFSTDHKQRAEKSQWYSKMEFLGYNYRLTDFQCALGLSQLKRLDRFIDRRREIAKLYQDGFRDKGSIRTLKVDSQVQHAWHLFVIRIKERGQPMKRDHVFKALCENGIGANIHYFPVHLQPYFQKIHGTREGLCPIAERISNEIISLPIFPGMADSDVKFVVDTLIKIVED